MPGKDTNIGAKRARQTRADLGLGPAEPVADVLRLTEQQAGIPVIVAGLPEGIAGCCWRTPERTLVWVNGTQAVVRQRFTVAHELGHVRCGHLAPELDTVATISGRTHVPNEVQANAFAAELLVPRAGIDALIDGAPDLETVVRLSARYGVSVHVALFRLNTLGRSANHDRLRREIEEDLHLEVLERLAPAQVADELAELDGHLPRIPDALAESALAAMLRGDAAVDATAGAVGADPWALADGLAMIAPG